MEFFSSRRAGIRAIITAFLQLTRFMSFSMIFRALFARGRLFLVKGGRTDGSELKFEVPKVIDYFFTLVHFRHFIDVRAVVGTPLGVETTCTRVFCAGSTGAGKGIDLCD